MTIATFADAALPPLFFYRDVLENEKILVAKQRLTCCISGCWIYPVCKFVKVFALIVSQRYIREVGTVYICSPERRVASCKCTFQISIYIYLQEQWFNEERKLSLLFETIIECRDLFCVHEMFHIGNSLPTSYQSTIPFSYLDFL